VEHPREWALMNKYFYLAITLAIVARFVPWTKGPVLPKELRVEKSIATLAPVTVKPDPIQVEVATATLPPEKKLDLAKGKRTPASIPRKKTVLQKLPNGLLILENYFALAVADFTPELGAVVAQKDNLIIMYAEERPMDAGLVAYDPKNDRYHPVSAVLKVTGVDANMRNTLKNAGFKENYYHEASQTAFLQSHPEKQLNDMLTLKSIDLKPELEIMRGFHRPR
jgi:hypothetical protein